MIFHLLDEAAWRASGDSVAEPGPEGFVHCCDERQLGDVRHRYFPTDAGVVALTLDPTLLSAETRYEPGSAGEPERFPHVYGPIARSDIIDVRVVG